MIENFNSINQENKKSNNKIKKSESIQNLYKKEKSSFLYLNLVYQNIYKNSSHSILKKILEKK